MATVEDSEWAMAPLKIESDSQIVSGEGRKDSTTMEIIRLEEYMKTHHQGHVHQNFKLLNVLAHPTLGYGYHGRGAYYA